MSAIEDTKRYLEGRIGAVEMACAIVLRATMKVDKSALDAALTQLNKMAPKDADPEFKRGFEEGVDQIRKRVARVEMVPPGSPFPPAASN